MSKAKHNNAIKALKKDIANTEHRLNIRDYSSAEHRLELENLLMELREELTELESEE